MERERTRPTTIGERPGGSCYHARMSWWLWVISGLGLLVVEMVTPGSLFALFFGVGALCVAPLAALGIPPVGQWIAFSVISVVLLVTLRNRLQERMRRAPPGPAVDSLVGQEVVLLADLPAGGEGKVELRGVPWSARAASGIPLARGQRCRVERVEGVLLYVTAVSSIRESGPSGREG
jgi:membrane protein implicated in regulation of membrane protease activity